MGTITITMINDMGQIQIRITYSFKKYSSSRERKQKASKFVVHTQGLQFRWRYYMRWSDPTTSLVSLRLSLMLCLCRPRTAPLTFVLSGCLDFWRSSSSVPFSTASGEIIVTAWFFRRSLNSPRSSPTSWDWLLSAVPWNTAASYI